MGGRVKNVTVNFDVFAKRFEKQFDQEDYEQYLKSILMDSLYEFYQRRDRRFYDEMDDEKAAELRFRADMALLLKNSIMDIEFEVE